PDTQLTDAKVVLTSATEGVPFKDQVVATFTDPGGSGPISDYTASIFWGEDAFDGFSTGTIVDNGNGHFSVLGSNTYQDEGGPSITVTLTHDQLPPVVATGPVNVQEAPLVARPITVNAKAGAPYSLAVHFGDLNLSAPTDDFTATVYWGDGAISMIPVGTVT